MTPVANPPTPPPHDLALDVVRALVLYALAEFQSGHASTIRVTAEGTSFSVADDGRGHAIDRIVAESPYLALIYTHLDYPFDPGHGAAPVQLQGIGISLINALCSELTVTVRKPEATLRLAFQAGQLRSSQRVVENSGVTGNTLAGTIRPQLQDAAIDLPRLQQWLLGLLAGSPSLKIFLNGVQLQAQHQGEA